MYDDVLVQKFYLFQRIEHIIQVFIKDKIVSYMKDAAMKNVEIGMDLLKQCAIDYGEMEQIESVTQELARIVLRRDNIENHFESITDFLNGNINVNQKPKKVENKEDNEEDKSEEKNEEDNYENDDDENKDDDNTEQYIDHYLICQMIEENKEKYPLRDISDLVRLKKIIFKLRLYMVLTESSVKEAEVLYILYEFPTTYLNFDKVLNKSITVQKYIEILANNFKLYDYFYIKLLGTEKNKVKLMKYVKTTKNLYPFLTFFTYISSFGSVSKLIMEFCVRKISISKSF